MTLIAVLDYEIGNLRSAQKALQHVGADARLTADPGLVREALGDKAGIRRFASGLYPLDEALVEVALDLSGRPYTVYDVPFGEVLPLGDPPFNPEMAEHFWQSFATAAGITLHVKLREGRNTHHIVEATFKGVARCLRDAVRVEGGGIPSTKGVV